jgi:cellulose biosynthesis protein BcsQ
MVARLGWRVLAVDLDPQANLTSAFFDEDQLEQLWEPESHNTVLSAVSPLMRGLGDVEVPVPREVAERLWAVPGDLGLSAFEDLLVDAWPRGFVGDEGAIRATTAFHRIIGGCAAQVRADVVFVDVGPNLGVINRAALLASDDVVVPLTADLFSLQAVRTLGPTLRQWRRAWQDLGVPKVPASIDAPGGAMQPIGYVVRQHVVRLDRPWKAHDRWLRRITTEFHRSVLAEAEPAVASGTDPLHLATMRDYRSLMPLAQDARKPMFDLRPGDGALGSTGRLVQICHREFEALAARVMGAARIPVPVAS